MTEAERNSFFAHSTQRAPGKRQIKPTAAMDHIVLPADEDEDDEDFKAELSGSGSEESSSESSEGSGEDEEESKEGAEIDDDTEYLKSLRVGRDDDDEDEEQICSLCLNLRPSTEKEEVIQCDKCGVAVHESCYGMDLELAGDADSTESASVTEPWFCEPCIYGVKEPPHCELCPDRYGTMKRSDVGGRWVHLLCALYTPGVTFGDADRLIAISWQEIDYKRFGRKACGGCSDRLESRTGLPIGCDAALCKNYYHATCAQKLGLLIDRSEEIADDEEEHDERFIHCKKHSHEDEVRRKREAYQRFIRQEEKRFASMLKRKKLNEREEEKRLKMQEKSRIRFKKMEGITISVPDASWDRSEKKNRRARHLHTSAKYLEAFSNKAEMVGVSRDDFEKAFVKVDGRTIVFLPPAFSPEFIAYFNHREKYVMSAERSRLERVIKQRDDLKEEQLRREKKFHELELDQKKAQLAVLAAQERVMKLHGVLARLGAKKLPKMADVVRKESTASSRTRLFSRSSICSEAPSTSRPSVASVMKKCATCEAIKDQHLLVECDACHLHYHLQCLTPPLDRMPTKRNFAWHCSDCAPDSSDDDDNGGIKKMIASIHTEDEDSNGARKLRVRSDSVKMRKKAEKEAELRDYRLAIGRGSAVKRTSKPNKRYSTERGATTATTMAALPPLVVLPMISPLNGADEDSDEPPSKRNRGRPRKTPSASNSPVKSSNGRLSMERSVSRRSQQPSLSPHGINIAKKLNGNGRTHADCVENGDDDEEQMEEIVIYKE